MNKITCVFYFMNRPISNVFVIIERIINVVIPNEKINIKNAIGWKLSKLVCGCRELCDF